MTDDLDLHGLAATLHRSYDWTARHWRELCHRQAMPWPFVGRERGQRPWWSAAAVAAWKAGAPPLFAPPPAPVRQAAANDLDQEPQRLRW